MSIRLEELKLFIIAVCKERMNHELPDDVDVALPVQQAFQLDSISMFELIVNLEEKYEIKIPDNDIETVGKMPLQELVQYLEGQKV